MLIDAVLPGGERGRHGLRRRARVRGFRRAGGHALRRRPSRRASPRISRSPSPARSGTRSDRSAAGRSGSSGGRPYLERHGRLAPPRRTQARTGGALVRAPGRPGGLPGPPHSRHPLLRLHPGGRARGAVRALHDPDLRRLGDLVLCVRGGGVCGGGELGGLPSRIPLRRVPRRGRARRAGGLARVALCQASPPPRRGVPPASGKIKVPGTLARCDAHPSRRRQGAVRASDPRASPRHRRGSRGRPVRVRTERERLRGGGRAVPRSTRDGRRRERDRRDRPRPRVARHRLGRQGDLPGVHLLRHGRGDRPRRRDAGLRGHRSRDP